MSDEQLFLEGMPERLYAAAPARLATYDDCPRRYRMTYLDDPAPPRGPAFGHTSVGASVHTALARWWDVPEARRTPEAGGRLLVECWLTDGFRDRRQAVDLRERARAAVERYLADLDPRHVPLMVERTVSATTGGASLWGRVDRVDDRAGEVVVVDYKAGRWVPTDEDAAGSLALAVYAAGAARVLRRPVRRVELHHVPSGTVASWEHTAASLSALLGGADTTARALRDLDERRPDLSEAEADAAFPALVAPRCGWCEVRSSCAPGRSVPPRRPWDALPTP